MFSLLSSSSYNVLQIAWIEKQQQKPNLRASYIYSPHRQFQASEDEWNDHSPSKAQPEKIVIIIILGWWERKLLGLMLSIKDESISLSENT